MAEKPYSKREIDQIVGAIRGGIKEGFHDTNERLDRIEVQTTKTNGRVGKLENWKWMMVGGLAVISAIIVPLFLDLIK